MNAPLPRSPLARRPAAILEVAARVLNARGVSDEWFADIAAELKVSRPALYSHFRDRDDLLLACYLQSIDTLDAAFESLRADADDEGAVLEAFLDTTISDDFPELAVVSEVEVLPETGQQLIRARWSELVARLASLVENGIAHGRLKPFDPMVVAHSVLALSTWAPLQRRLLPGRPIDAVRAGTQEFFLRGLARDRARELPRQAVAAVLEPTEVNLFDPEAVAAAKKEQLLGAASKLFNRRGIGATRIEEIAEAMGVSKRAIFRIFGSKDQLVTACFERASEMNQRIAREATELKGDRALALHAGIRSAVLIMGDGRRPSLTSHVGLGRLTPGDQASMRSRFAGLEQAYRSMLRKGIDEGSIRGVNVDDVLAALAGNLNWVASTDLSRFEIPVEQVANQLADIALTGILV